MRSILVLAIVACSGGAPAPATPGPDRPVVAPGGGDTPVASPPGSSGDTPVASPTGGDTPVASPTPGTNEPAMPPSCDKKIAIKCRQGIDGCTGGKTSYHWCIPTDAKAGPGCEKEIALVCPEGQVDACTRTPPIAKNHICVYN